MAVKIKYTTLQYRYITLEDQMNRFGTRINAFWWGFGGFFKYMQMVGLVISGGSWGAKINF